MTSESKRCAGGWVTDSCDGYAQTQRMLLRIVNTQGDEITSDFEPHHLGIAGWNDDPVQFQE